LALERITLQPGHAITGQALESRLLSLEAGSLELSLQTDSPEAVFLTATDGTGNSSTVEAGTDLMLSSGDIVALPASAAYTLRSGRGGPATVAVASIYDPDAPSRTTPRADPAYSRLASAWPESTTVQPLAGGLATEVASGPTTGGVGRVTLAPGAALVGLTAPGPLLVGVDTGAVEFAMDDGRLWMHDGKTGARRGATAGTLATGDGALISANDAITFRNMGNSPAIITLVAIVPAE
jgi:hypothetical protein